MRIHYKIRVYNDKKVTIIATKDEDIDPNLNTVDMKSITQVM